ncbi:UDP-glucose dehydrogenase family protein [Alicyclobacillus fructus]|uniref:UDP-glucose dehydrogenase family protein n=1 Tax=Alicyclobacillus fructus TaxID=2816082 RepID=UPI001A8D52B2|nr:UDP-glucose/GDP-mannose dehydrogenase family protein [Alicyclobacillus fructus]
MKVCMMGTGYVGLVTAVCMAEGGHDVLAVDTDVRKIESLRRGGCPIFEPGLESVLQTQLANGRLRFATELTAEDAVDVAFIAVGTPTLPDGSVDLTAVWACVEELARKLPTGAMIAMKSTVPVGTASKIRKGLADRGRDDLRVASVPEFLREGTALEDTRHPHRLVFGVASEEDETLLRRLHAWVDAPVVVTDRNTAELIKYASNAFLATKISFINEIANLCERVGADVTQVAFGMGLDPRIGPSFLRAGLGYGGSCFPKDTKALAHIAEDVDYEFKLLRAVIEVNAEQWKAPIRALEAHFGDLRGLRVVLLGVAFKPGTDDVRESPAIALTTDLERRGCEVVHCDPVVQTLTVEGRLYPVTDRPSEALQGADAAVLVTEWPVFLDMDWEDVARRMRSHFLFDGRNALADVASLEGLGFTVLSVGRAGCKTANRSRTVWSGDRST